MHDGAAVVEVDEDEVVAPAVAVPVAGDRRVVADAPTRPLRRNVGRKAAKLWTTHSPLSVSQSMRVVEPAVVVPVADDELVVAAAVRAAASGRSGGSPDIEWMTQLPVSLVPDEQVVEEAVAVEVADDRPRRSRRPSAASTDTTGV